MWGEEVGIGSGIGTGGASNGGLVDAHDLGKTFRTFELFKGCGGIRGIAAQSFGKGGIESLIDEGGFARTRDTRVASESTYRDMDIHIFKIVALCANEGKVMLCSFAFCWDFNLFNSKEVACGMGAFFGGFDGLKIALCHYFSAVRPRAGTDINNIVGFFNGVFIMFPLR